MKSLAHVLTNKKLFLASVAWGWLELAFFPKPMLLFFLAGTMIIDLITGLVKSWKNGVATNYQLLQKTVIKITMYCSVIISAWIMVNIFNTINKSDINYAIFVNGLIGVLSFIELYSIFSNIYEIDPKGPLSLYVVGPILKLLKSKLNNNPIHQLENEENNENDRTA